MICASFIKSKINKTLTYGHLKCGKCYACRMNKAREWALRLHWEDKMHAFSQFVTMTYAEENCHWKISKFDGEPRKNIHYKDGTQFINSIRQAMKREGHPDIIRYFMICEYGKKNTRHAHWHVMLWGCPYDVNRLRRIWNKGNVHVGYIQPQSIAYVSGYTWKRQDEYVNKHGLNPEKPFMSKGKERGTGLGFNYVKQD